MSYKEVTNYVFEKYGYKPKTCWIAHCKEICDIRVKPAYNRIDLNSRKNPCPKDKQDHIIEALKHFNMYKKK